MKTPPALPLAFLKENHHLTKNEFIGATKANGQFKILKKYKDVVGDPFLRGTYK